LAQVFADLVYESTTTTGSGTITLAGAYTTAGPAQTFASGVGTGNTCCYCITSGSNWEVGNGTVGGSGPYTLSRDTIFASSNVVSGVPLAITLAGTSLVANVIPAAKTPFPVSYQGVWSGSAAYGPYDLVLYNGDVFFSVANIAAPTATTAISSPTTATPSAGTTWNLTYSTGGTDRLVYLCLQIPNQGASAGAITSVTSPNVTWTKTVDKGQGGFGFSNYLGVWQGQAGPQLVNEAITISLTGGSYSGSILAYDVSGLNFSGTLNDPNALIPNVGGGTGAGAINVSYTTTNADDVLFFVASTGDVTVSTTPPSGFTYIGSVGAGFGSTAAFYQSVSATQSATTVSATGSSYQAWIGAGLAVEYPASPGNIEPPNDDRWQRVTALSTMFDELFGSSTGTMVARGTSGWQGVGPLSNGQLLIGNSSSGLPTPATISAGSNITVTNAPGGITVAASGASVSGLWGPTMSATPTISSMGLTTWFNQGSATANNHSSGMSIIVPASSGTNVRGMYFTAPTPPYSYKALITLTSSTSAYAYTMLGWYNGTSTLSVFALLSNGAMGNNLEMDNWTATGFSGSNVGQFSVYCNPIWARIRDDGTNVHFAYSMTGDDNEFMDVYAVAKSSGTLGSSGYSNIFFGGNSQNNAQVIATCMSWALGT
jgi:hypothetical protein